MCAQLRRILLNHSSMAAELASWRVATGYDKGYAAFCARYGFNFHVEALAEGVPRRSMGLR